MKLCLFIVLVSFNCFAEQTVSEKAVDITRDSVREVKKGVNRVKEMACAKSDLKCSQQKLQHRIEEKKDEVVDKMKKYKEKID